MIPNPGQTILNFASFIIMLGVVQGTILTIIYFMQRTWKGIYSGLFFLSFTLIIAEIFLNRTGYMYSMIWLVDFSEPFQYAIAPLTYLIIREIDSKGPLKHTWAHFIPLFLYFIYFIPFYLAPDDYKFHSYYFIHHTQAWHSVVDYSFYHHYGIVRNFQLQLCVLQMTIYMVLNFQMIFKCKKSEPDRALTTNKEELNWWFLFNCLMIIFMVVIVLVKYIFIHDLGDHIIAAFLTFVIYLNTIRELTKSIISSKQQIVAEPKKYNNSGLKDDKKQEVLEKLVKLMEEDRMYTDSLISLARIGKRISEPPYVISQIINEKLSLTFYDWVAFYRVEAAKAMLQNVDNNKLTIEEIAENVGYNSKSAFNKAFKKFTTQTPSEYRIK